MGKGLGYLETSKFVIETAVTSIYLMKIMSSDTFYIPKLGLTGNVVYIVFTWKCGLHCFYQKVGASLTRNQRLTIISSLSPS
jgi:hypothetical protein